MVSLLPFSGSLCVPPLQLKVGHPVLTIQKCPIRVCASYSIVCFPYMYTIPGLPLASFPGLPCFCSSLIFSVIHGSRRTGGGAGNTYHMNGVKWMRGAWTLGGGVHIRITYQTSQSSISLLGGTSKVH